MNHDLFKDGGPHKIQKTGEDEYSMSISIPTDEDGLLGRGCKDPECSPAYFKVKLGTGITEDHNEAFCPYCGISGEPNDFFTQSQVDYVQELVMRQATDGISKAIEDAIGLGPSRKRKFGNDMFSIEMSYKPGHRPPIGRPIEEELRRDVICPHCTLEHAVFGLAIWCPDCGEDIFLTHVEKEFEVVKKMLGAVENRREQLGARVAARDVENALEDVVSIFEAVLRVEFRRNLEKLGKDDIDKALRKVGNAFQNIERAEKVWKEEVGVDLCKGLSEDEILMLKNTFEKRHPITHNLGIVDRKYLDNVRSGELEGRDVRVDAHEVENALELCVQIIKNVHLSL